MAQLNDLIFASLREAGYKGALPDMRYEFFKVQGVSTWREYYLANGGTGQLNDWLFEHFGGGGPGPGPGPGDDPAWEAVTPDPTTYEMLAQRIGQGTPTFTHSGLLLPDNEGLYQNIAANEAPWHSGRVVSNRFSSGEVGKYFDSSDLQTMPAGPLNATILNATDIQFVGADYAYFRPADVTKAGDKVLIRFKVLAGTTIANIGLRCGDWTFTDSGANNLNIDLTGLSEDTVFVFEATQNSGVLYSEVGFDNRPGFGGTSVAGVLSVTDFQIEANTGSVIPGEYIRNAFTVSGINEFSPATAAFANLNGNTVLNNVVTEAVGAPLPELPSLYAAPAMTNLSTWSNDQTGASWGVSNDATALQDAVGITGEPNTACTLTDTTTSIGEVFQNVSVANDSNPSVVRIFVKKNTEQGYVPEFGLDYSGGTAQRERVRINTATGESATRATAGTTDHVVDSIDGWWVVYIEVYNNSSGNNLIKVLLSPAASQTLGGIPNATGSNIIGNVEVFSGMTIAQVKGAAPIITEGSTVSTTAVEIEYDIANHSEVQGGYYNEYMEFAPYSGGSSQRTHIFVTNTSTSSYVLGSINNSGSSIYSNDQTSAVEADLPSAPGALPSNTIIKSGMSYGATEGLRSVQTESDSVEGAYDGSFSSNIGIRILVKRNGTPLNHVATVRNLQRWDLPYAEAKTKIDELLS